MKHDTLELWNILHWNYETWYNGIFKHVVLKLSNMIHWNCQTSYTGIVKHWSQLCCIMWLHCDTLITIILYYAMNVWVIFLSNSSSLHYPEHVWRSSDSGQQRVWWDTADAADVRAVEVLAKPGGWDESHAAKFVVSLLFLNLQDEIYETLQFVVSFIMFGM